MSHPHEPTATPRPPKTPRRYWVALLLAIAGCLALDAWLLTRTYGGHFGDLLPPEARQILALRTTPAP